jgi:hypothetical protein
VPGDANLRWLNGVVEWLEDTVGWELSQDCSTVTTAHGDQEGHLDPLAAVPFVIRTSVTCPYLDIPTMSDRVRARLESITSRAIARELWTGENTIADPYTLPAAYTTWLNPPAAAEFTNPYLTQAGATVVGGTGLDALSALGAVEAAVGELITSGPVYLHAPVSIINDAAWALERRGDLLTTMTGAIVVADYGYPIEATPQIHGTGQVQVWTGDIQVDNNPSEVLTKEDNQARVWAQRPAMYLFDPRSLVTCTVV